MKSIEEIAEMDNTYDTLIKRLQEAKTNQLPIDEGLIGMLGGVTVGPALMRAVCSALGINEKGALGNLMTSRLVLTAIGSQL